MAHGREQAVHALPAGGHRAGDGDAEGIGQAGAVGGETERTGLVHHVEGQGLGHAHFGELHGEVQGAAQVLGVAHLQDGLELVAEQDAGGDGFVLAAGWEGDDAGRVDDHRVGDFASCPLGDLHRGAGVVGHDDILPGEMVKEDRLANVGVADQGNAPSDEG